MKTDCAWKCARAFQNNGPDYWVISTGEWRAPSIAIVEQEDHARLIAAAPDLLVALENLLTMISTVLTDTQLDHVNCGDTIRRAIDPARAAIAKAKHE